MATKNDLLIQCELLGITKCKSKTKNQLLGLINQKTMESSAIIASNTMPIEETMPTILSVATINHTGPKFIDLFCGIGGFHQALLRLNGTCVFACDIDEKCRNVYQQNYGLCPASDITKIVVADIPAFDILCAGFPCFVAGTQTLTNKGYKNIEDVEITDMLLTHKGNFQNIMNLQRKIYTGDVFDIKIKYHPELITTTEEHPFYVREKKGNIFGNSIWKKANELTMNDYFGMVINSNEIIPEFTFEKSINQYKTEKQHIKLDNLDHWFVMGYLVGDGWIEETKKTDGRCMYKIRFAINNKDEEYVFERINRIIPITDKKCNSGKCKKFGCSNFMWYNILKQFGKYAHGKIMPEWVQDAPKEFIQEFINGYMKADGCIVNRNILQITTVSPNLAYGLQRLYLKLGHIFYVNKCVRPTNCVIDGRTVNQRDTYCVRGALQKERKISSFIEDNYVWFAPFKITKRNITEIPVYNFEVENDNSYIVMNTIVHNCQAFSNSGKKKGFSDARGGLFEHILKIATVKRPSFMFLENVKHIKKIDNGQVYAHILKRINESGYTVREDTVFELSPHQLGIPQQRERVIFVCIRADLFDASKIIIISPPPTPICFSSILETDASLLQKYRISTEIENVLNAWEEMVQTVDEEETLSPTIMCNEFHSQYSQEEFLALPDWKQDYMTKNKPIYQKYKPQWDEWYDRHKSILTKREIYGKLEWQVGKVKPQESIFNHFIQFRQSGIRVKRAIYFPTLVAIVQTPIYAKEKRYITPRECARLQSFPDNFILHESDHTAYKQLGNAVNVDVVHYVIRETLNVYNNIL